MGFTRALDEFVVVLGSLNVFPDGVDEEFVNDQKVLMRALVDTQLIAGVLVVTAEECRALN